MFIGSFKKQKDLLVNFTSVLISTVLWPENVEVNMSTFNMSILFIYNLNHSIVWITHFQVEEDLNWL